MSKDRHPSLLDSPKRDKILNVARFLFEREGYHRVSIERISAEAHIPKTTIYRHFATKEDLIFSSIQQQLDNVERKLALYINAAKDPNDKLFRLFNWYTKWFQEKAFFGCMFIHAIAEFGNIDPDINALIDHQKNRLVDGITEILELFQVSDDNKVGLAQQISMLIDGAIVRMEATGDFRAAEKAYQVASALVNAAITLDNSKMVP